MIAVEPNSGKIRVWIGDLDYKYFQYDQVEAPRQVGSVFKPVVYSAAIPANAFYINLPALPEKDKNTSIETIILPKGTINIFNLAFKNCVALKSLTILSATTLGYNATAFEGCDALESM